MYRGNSEEVLHLVLPGSLTEGEIPSPPFWQLGDLVRSLDQITNYVNPHIDEGLYSFRLVGAQSGSLEIWLQLIAVSGVAVACLADGPSAVRNLVLALEALKQGGGVAQLLPRRNDFTPGEEHIVAVVDRLRKSVRKARGITIRYGDLEVILTDVDFVHAERPPRNVLEAPRERARSLPKKLRA